MSVDTVRTFLKPFGLDASILEFPVSSATVELAAQALGCAPQHIAKTLCLRMGEGCVLVVAAGDAKIDNAKFKACFGTKATLLAPQDVECLTGHAVGGVCPFATPPGTAVYLDVSLQRFSVVFPACGSSNSAIALTLPQLEQVSGSRAWVDVCKGWQ